MLSGLLLNELPWGTIGFGALHGINFKNAGYGVPTVVCLIVAYGLAVLPSQPLKGRMFPSVSWSTVGLALVIGMAAGNVARNKTASFSNWLSHGGLAIMKTENLVKRDWQPQGHQVAYLLGFGEQYAVGNRPLLGFALTGLMFGVFVFFTGFICDFVLYHQIRNRISSILDLTVDSDDDK